MRQLLTAVLVSATVGYSGLAFAADTKEDPTGTWKWTVTFGQQSREMTLKLKLDGDKLTGAMVGRDGKETAIEDGKFADNTVSFSVVREGKNGKTTSKYSGKLSGDTIKGKTESGREKARSRDWEAKRAKS